MAEIKKIKIGNVEYDIHAATSNIAYATCSTAADVATKIISIVENENWSLTTGSIIMVSFANTNTASNVKLNVNNTGEYPIWYNNAEYTSTGNAYTGYAGRVTTYMFNGTHWVWISNSYDANTQSNTNSTDTNSKIFLVGATSQGSNKTTYSHNEVYVGTDHHVYSNSKQVVNLSDTQALTNKTYNGYTLGAACEKSVDTSATSGSTNLITSGAVYTALNGKLSTSGTAAKATADASGNVIASTYATKTELNNLSTNALQKTGDTMEGVLKFTEGVHYGSGLPENGEEGQIFFLEESLDGAFLPDGGTQGQVLIKNSAEDGDAIWGEIVALPAGGSSGQVLTKNSDANGDAKWTTITTTDKKVTQAYSTATTSHPLLFAATAGTSSTGSRGDSTAIVNNAIYAVPSTGTLYSTKVYGAVYNDYAEYRELREDIEIPYGRVVIENGDDTLSLSTERLQGGGNICSDTFGFAIGETERAKLPIAVSGRVLVYPLEDRNSYAPGDAVCTGPKGTVSKMTREEIKEWPDRIIGYVSAVPAYETWGQNNVAVNGRIWIKVK